MGRDSQSKLSKREQMKRSKKEDDKSRNKKKNEESDSDNNSEDESENEMDVHEYRKFLSKIFPSKHLTNKIKAGEKVKNKDSDSDDEDKKEYFTSKNKKHRKIVEEEEEEWETESEERPKKKSTKNKKKKAVESESEDETLGSQDTDDDDDEDYEEEEDEEDEDYEEEEDEEEEEESNKKIKSKKGSNKLNIIFTIGGTKADEEDEEEWIDEEDEDYVDSDEETEDEDASVSSSSSDEDDEEEIVVKKSKKNSKQIVKKENEKEIVSTESPCEKSTNDDKKITNEMLEQLKQMLEKNPKDKSIKKCIEVYEADIKKQKAKQEKKDIKHKDKNMRIFKKIVKDKNTMNDFSFYEKLGLIEQKKIIKELKEINKITRIEKPYRMTLLESNIPVQFKSAAMKKINSLRYMEPGSGEYYKIKNWVDTFMRIPFGKTEDLPISIEDGVEKCHDFMENAQKTLNNAVYGLNDAKMQIMQMLGQLLTNPKAIGTAIAIHGPPGTGKTSLVKEGISKILNRPFAFIALGGATDSSFLEGHGYTYEGSTWGKIVQILIDSKCMNPVIYFDELDKISDTPRGEEIAGILTHLTDTSQNSQFHDKYFAEINFDLSKCLFIFSYNDESKINPILKDRMYRIKTKGYNQKEKTVISNSYLLPRIREQVRFDQSQIMVNDATIHYIIDNHCNKEDGVRNLKRCLEIIYTKLNLYRLMKPESNLFEQDMSLKVEFPFTVTKDIVDKLIKKETENISALYSMYA
jgi:ATP-dependent Lon protease